MTSPVASAEESSRVNLLGLTLRQMEQFFLDIGEKKFRAQQVLKWIHHAGVTDIEQMTNIGKALREKLQKIAEVRPPEIVSQHDSSDGTRKWAIRVDGGGLVESVLIPEGSRATLCVSSQVGCSLDCSFCSTGKQGFQGDLTAAEIIGQVWVALKSYDAFQPGNGRLITNVVMMGMGEPLLNFDAVLPALSLMRNDLGFGFAAKRVTVSTAGLVPGIYRLREAIDVALAVSLHSPVDDVRVELVPLNRKYPIAELMQACRDYVSEKHKRTVTFEYTLIDGVNDHPEHARKLVKLLRTVPSKLNLIPFNPFPGTQYRCSSQERITRFQEIVMQGGLIATVRKTRGEDIDAACGQLVGKVQDRTKRSERIKTRMAEITP